VKKTIWQSLPDYSADWEPPEKKASDAEVEARFYSEFARESETILRLTETVRDFSRGELLRARLRTENYPGSALDDLHPYCFRIVFALIPRINLREIGWNQLKSEQQKSLIDAFSRPEPAFRRLGKWELIEFAEKFIHPTEPEYKYSDSDPVVRHLADISPRWHAGSRLYCRGIEEIAIRIDWNQGPQAVKKAMEEWFVRHKRGLDRLKQEGKLPDSAHGSHMYHLRDETGAKTPRRKYLAALRGLGAMRLLSSHTLLEAIEKTKGYKGKEDSLYWGFIDDGEPAGRRAWNRGIEYARRRFQDLFYPRDNYSLHIRRSRGLPEIEEPISYQRYCSRVAKNKSRTARRRKNRWECQRSGPRRLVRCGYFMEVPFRNWGDKV